MLSVGLSASEYGLEAGAKPVLLILHGLFGSSTNWHSMAKKLASSHQVYALDLRNHGESPWGEDHSYPALAQDVKEFIESNDLHDVAVLGHSMGGKVAMQLALAHPQRLSRLIIADMAPVSYPDNEHPGLIRTMQSLELSQVHSRADADEALQAEIKNKIVRQFLLQNLVLNTDSKRWQWRVNLSSLKDNLENIMSFPTHTGSCALPSLFLYGEKSDYLKPAIKEQTRTLFSQAQFKGIKDAGHWLHAEQPAAFFEACEQFLNA